MSGAKRVLLVDDDRTLQSLLAEQLETTKEFTTTCVNDAAGAIDIVQNDHFDLVLLDVGLPDMDGRDVCKELRRLGVRAPILMLTAADADTDTIRGLESGANDRSEEHTSELQSLMRNSYAVFCLQKKK